MRGHHRAILTHVSIRNEAKEGLTSPKQVQAVIIVHNSTVFGESLNYANSGPLQCWRR